MILHILKRKTYRLIAVGSSLAIFALFLLSMMFISNSAGMPFIWALQDVWNNSAIQLILLPVISALFGILVALQVYEKKGLPKMQQRELGLTTSGSVFGFVSSLGAAGGCPACLIVLSSLIGTAATAFLHNFSLAISLVSVALLSLSVYLVNQKISGKCSYCR